MYVSRPRCGARRDPAAPRGFADLARRVKHGKPGRPDSCGPRDWRSNSVRSVSASTGSHGYAWSPPQSTRRRPRRCGHASVPIRGALDGILCGLSDQLHPKSDHLSQCAHHVSRERRAGMLRESGSGRECYLTRFPHRASRVSAATSLGWARPPRTSSPSRVTKPGSCAAIRRGRGSRCGRGIRGSPVEFGASGQGSRRDVRRRELGAGNRVDVVACGWRAERRARSPNRPMSAGLSSSRLAAQGCHGADSTVEVPNRSQCHQMQPKRCACGDELAVRRVGWE